MNNIVERPKFTLSPVYQPFWGRFMAFFFYTIAIFLIFGAVFKDLFNWASSIYIGVFLGLSILSFLLAMISPFIIKKYRDKIRCSFYDSHLDFFFSEKYCYEIPYTSIVDIQEKKKDNKKDGGLVDLYIETEEIPSEGRGGLKLEDQHVIILHNVPYSERPLAKIRETITRYKQRLPVQKTLH